ncbi:hypothetical protein ACFL49_02240 [Candidatus Omnitrophota bacterium]
MSMNISEYLKEFVIRQKCIPWFVIAAWRKLCQYFQQMEWTETEMYKAWSIGVYKMSLEEGVIKFNNLKGIKNPVLTAKNSGEEDIHFVADPFIVYENGMYYVFFEVFKNEKGIIGLAESKDCKKWKYTNRVLEEPFHLSYPQVFKCDGKFYMIPECYESKSIRLYEAGNFPYEWRFVKTLLEGRDYVDSTIFFFENKLWLFSSDTTSGNLFLYYSDSLDGIWKEHSKNPIIENNNSIARPGGNVLRIENRLIRIAQDDSDGYGHAVRAFEISKLNTEEYEENELPESPLFKASGKGWNKTGMHHLSACSVGENEWRVVADGKVKCERNKIFNIFIN